jgi:hypothetical protein
MFGFSNDSKEVNSVASLVDKTADLFSRAMAMNDALAGRDYAAPLSTRAMDVHLVITFGFGRGAGWLLEANNDTTIRGLKKYFAKFSDGAEFYDRAMASLQQPWGAYWCNEGMKSIIEVMKEKDLEGPMLSLAKKFVLVGTNTDPSQ